MGWAFGSLAILARSLVSIGTFWPSSQDRGGPWQIARGVERKRELLGSYLPLGASHTTNVPPRQPFRKDYSSISKRAGLEDANDIICFDESRHSRVEVQACHVVLPPNGWARGKTDRAYRNLLRRAESVALGHLTGIKSQTDDRSRAPPIFVDGMG